MCLHRYSVNAGVEHLYLILCTAEGGIECKGGLGHTGGGLGARSISAVFSSHVCCVRCVSSMIAFFQILVHLREVQGIQSVVVSQNHTHTQTHTHTTQHTHTHALAHTHTTHRKMSLCAVSLS